MFKILFPPFEFELVGKFVQIMYVFVVSLEFLFNEQDVFETSKVLILQT